MSGSAYDNDRRVGAMYVLGELCAGLAAAAVYWLVAQPLMRTLASGASGLPWWLDRSTDGARMALLWMSSGLVTAGLVLGAVGKRLPRLSAPADRLAGRIERGLQVGPGTPRLLVGPRTGDGDLMMAALAVAGLVLVVLVLQPLNQHWRLVGGVATAPLTPALALLLGVALASALRMGVSERLVAANQLLLTALLSAMVAGILPGLPPGAGEPAARPLLWLTLAALVVAPAGWLVSARRRGRMASGFDQMVLTDQQLQIMERLVRRGGQLAIKGPTISRGEPLTFCRAGATTMVLVGQRGRPVMLDTSDADALRAAAEADGWPVTSDDSWPPLRRAEAARRLRTVLVLMLMLVCGWGAGPNVGATVALQCVALPAMSDAFMGRITKLPPEVLTVAERWPNDAVVQATVGMAAEALGDAPLARPCWLRAAQHAAPGSKVALAAAARLAPHGLAPFLGTPGRGYTDRH